MSVSSSASCSGHRMMTSNWGIRFRTMVWVARMVSFAGIIESEQVCKATKESAVMGTHHRVSTIDLTGNCGTRKSFNRSMAVNGKGLNIINSVAFFVLGFNDKLENRSVYKGRMGQ